MLFLDGQEGKSATFRDIVTYFKRDKGQISTLLKKLAREKVILKGETRPQKIALTYVGIKLAKEKTSELRRYISNSQNVAPEIKRLNKEALFDKFILKITPDVKATLSDLAEYMTPDALDSVRDQLIETIQDSLHSFFAQIELLKK